MNIQTLNLKINCLSNKNLTQQAKSLFCYILTNYKFNAFFLDEKIKEIFPFIKNYFRELTLENLIKREIDGFVVNQDI